MLIGGFTPNSYVDYPENIAAVIFLCGCNFDCFYCHNKHLLTPRSANLDLDEIKDKITSRKNFLDGVVITGGEPTLHNADELISLLKFLKGEGLKTKLDTNGTRPEVLIKLSPYLDYIAMDIKAPLEKYPSVTRISENDIPNIQKSIELVKERGGEFRTTVFPSMTVSDIADIAKTIAGGKAVYYLQAMRPTEELKDKRVCSKEFLFRAAEESNKYLKTVLRGI